MRNISYSEIKRWRFCRQAHNYQYVMGLVPKVKPKPLKMGDLIHKCVEALVTKGRCDHVIKDIRREFKRMFDEEREEYGDLPGNVERISSKYFSIWGDERNTITNVEETFGPIPFTRETQFKLRIDRLSKLKSFGLLLCETKTCKTLPEEDMRMWDLQTVLYVWALRELGYPIDGVMWDYIRTKPPTIPEVLKNGKISKKKNIDTDYDTYKKAIMDNCPDDIGDYKEILDNLKKSSGNRFFKRVILPVNDKMIEPILTEARISAMEIVKLSELPVRNISGFTCPRCQYSTLCYATLKGLDVEFIMSREFRIKKEKGEVVNEAEEGEE